MSKRKKFQHKWISDPELVKSKETQIWCLTYTDGKGVFCELSRMTNILHPSNNSNVGNSDATLDVELWQ